MNTSIRHRRRLISLSALCLLLLALSSGPAISVSGDPPDAAEANLCHAAGFALAAADCAMILRRGGELLGAVTVESLEPASASDITGNRLFAIAGARFIEGWRFVALSCGDPVIAPLCR